MSEVSLKTWIAIPIFNHEIELKKLLSDINMLNIPVIVVDDGSTPPIKEEEIVAKNITVLRHSKNLGKGVAIRTASQYALFKKAEIIITIDADGQHDPKEIPIILNKAIESQNHAIIIGSRKFQKEKIPLLSRIGRILSNFVIYLETGKKFSDTQSGFRAYPARIFQNFSWTSSGYEFETEVLVKCLLAGIPCEEVEISVKYPSNRISHFRFLREMSRFTILHSKLMFYSLFIGKRKSKHLVKA